MIDENAVKALREYAEQHVISLEETMKIYRREAKCAGDRKEHCLMMPVGFKLVFSIEWIGARDMKNKAKLKRMSLSSSTKNKDGSARFPNMPALKILADLLGFSEIGKEQCGIRAKENDPIPNIEVFEELERKALYKIERFHMNCFTIYKIYNL